MLNLLSHTIKLILGAALLSSLYEIVTGEQQMKAVQFDGNAQGTTWNVTYYANDSLVQRSDIDSILLVIDSSLSIYNPYSTIVAFNKSKQGTKTDPHFSAVIKRSLEIYSKTNHLSDITVGPLVNAWGFGAKRSEAPPTDSLVRSLLTCVGSDKIAIRNDSLIKLEPCVRVDVNGIAQGYTVDIIAAFFEKQGVDNYLVELGGELRVKGKKYPGGKPFRVGIESPANDDFISPPMQRTIQFDSGALTTSGNYRKFYESGGKTISHIINPLNGQPVSNELISVTVYARDAITADAYDNALMLMGLKEGMAFVERNAELGAFFIYKKQDGSIADTASSRFNQIFDNR